MAPQAGWLRLQVPRALLQLVLLSLLQPPPPLPVGWVPALAGLWRRQRAASGAAQHPPARLEWAAQPLAARPRCVAAAARLAALC